jgi:hypothetical protein
MVIYEREDKKESLACRGKTTNGNSNRDGISTVLGYGMNLSRVPEVSDGMADMTVL